MTEALCAQVDAESGTMCYLAKGHGLWPGSSPWHEGANLDDASGPPRRWPPADEPVAPTPYRAPERPRQQPGPRGRATIATSVRFSPETHARINAAAEERDVSARWLIERLVSEGLDRLIPVDQIRWTSDPES